jgi:polyketide synthase PksL
MIDFIEYVVAELKSKRLSKTDALALVKQFSVRPSVPAPMILHPLLHHNTSDLSEQRYSSTFTGEEFFLTDHQVKTEGQAGQKVLPAVAYLEMVRAAIEQAVPVRPEGRVLELRNIVWATPVVVREAKQVNVVLTAQEKQEEIECEIYSREGESETVHCAGRAVWSSQPVPAKLDMEQLNGQMKEGKLKRERVYGTCARMGLMYGPAMQGVTEVQRGTGEVLAQLRLPPGVEEKWGEYVLHPSLMDSALQAAVGLLEGELESTQARLPFALEVLRVVAPCAREMVAWVRYAPGSQATDKVVKLDLDLCDGGGSVCVQMLGLSTRVLRQEVTARAAQSLAIANLEKSAVESNIEPQIDTESLVEKTQRYLQKQFSGLLKVPFQKIEPQDALEKYGIDSILAMKLTNQLEKPFGSLPKTLFFEYQTIHQLSEYFAANYSAQLTALFTTNAGPTNGAGSVVAPTSASVPAKVISSKRFSRRRMDVPNLAKESEAIAIVGISGRYPEALNLKVYWQNLRAGKDCITEVPKERWDWREYYSEDRTKSGHHYSKWGGFIAGVDEFDPLFFNISPLEAELTDPQERLFLQHAWMAMEDAGYTRASLRAPWEQDLIGQVGVYVGVMYSEYQLFGAEASLHGKRMRISGSFASIANRVSYVLNLHGPSMTLDTMCSSSLSAIHIACQDLKLGRTSLGIAGAVNVSIHPNKYMLLSEGQFISSDGHCQSFGEGGDGYIPGEAVGVVVLKRLSEAKRDGDHIYGIIRGSALNHGGKTNGYTVPNPQAQASVISRALREAKVEARHISYIEAHGTGTKLGDPIEIVALSKAFEPHTSESGFCRIGSVKSNIGHCESAAGIAGLTKVLLQMQHRQIVPSLHAEQLNPHIDFSKTPFVVNQQLTEWEQPEIEGRKLPRIAGISSFGAGGSNAHLIVEEYLSPEQPMTAVGDVIILLSARTAGQLKQRARDLLAFLNDQSLVSWGKTIDLTSMAYTLQVGREAMEERLGLVVNSVEQLVEKLEAYIKDEQEIEDAYQGQVKRSAETLSLFSTDADLQQMIDKWIANRKFSKLLDLWVKGLEVDWSKLYGEAKPQRISLPTYPFAKERYWIDRTTDRQTSVNGVIGGTATAILHPLLHRNTSDLSQQRYSSTFTGNEFFLADHRVVTNGHGGQKVLPGVAYLEMARAAIEHAWPEQPETAILELRNIVWAQPVVVSEKKQVSIVLTANDAGDVDYEIYSQDAEQESVHCQGCAIWSRQPAPAKLDIEQLKFQMARGHLAPDSVYAACARMGLVYGPAFQGIAAIYRGSNQVLAQLRLPSMVDDKLGNYVLHPSLMDGALQAAVGLVDSSAETSTPLLPFSLDSLRIVSRCGPEMVAWVRYAPASQPADNVVKLDIDLCDERGNVCVQMHGLSSRVLSQETKTMVSPDSEMGTLLAVPVWETRSVAVSASPSGTYTEHHVVLCELPKVDADKLKFLLPHSHCLSLQSGEQKNIAQRYSEYALACFEQIQSVLRGKPQGRVLVQVVVPCHGEQALLAGLSGLVKTAALENPQIRGQLILIPAEMTTEELGWQLNEEKARGSDTQIKYEQGVRKVLRWEEIAVGREKPPMAFKEHGIYLITGGLGGLGVLFAKEILEQAPHARVVLTGRSALTPEKQARLDGLSSHTGRVSYRQVDLEDLNQVKRLIASIQEEYSQLNGILHSAGMIADSFIVKKTPDQIRQVLAPKVTGTYHLDQASQDIELDFFVLFSSLAGAMGNFGQADYALANNFMDQFVAYRNRQVAAKQRRGQTRSINWPLWQAGGMGIDAAIQELLRQATGMQPMETATGLQAFYRSLALPYDQMLVAEGDFVQMRRTLLVGPVVSTEPQPVQLALASEADAESLAEKTQEYLREQFAGLLKLPSHKIDPQAPLENYGIDSILAMKLTNLLEQAFGSLSKTLFFEYQTIASLARHLMKAYPAIIREKVGLLREEPNAKDAARTTTENGHGRRATTIRRKNGVFGSKANDANDKDIAIVGLAGRYPQAENLEEFWVNLVHGRDCITNIPRERWDNELYYNSDPSKLGTSYSKWGGFIADVDKFDPLFFNISPKEAALMDPQERLFLETAWQTIEDAGYSKDTISGKRVGVFVGVMWAQYELLGAQSILCGSTAIPNSSHASIANRVSYFFDFHGPSISLDTMCSSSLTAIHLACEELRKSEIDAALAGGVNLTIHPYKYLSLSQGKFAASDGRCRSFGKGGDGYVPGEGVGAVLLKPLQDALRDGDQIYAVIKSSTVNHGGKTNGYTVPNPKAQADLIVGALNKANIDPKTLSYVETHGTGTSLGDPIEITALSKAFEGSTEEKQFCPIGSVKSNIGHLEAAAGIAAVTKALLQIKYNQLVPSLHADHLNPNINFKDSPFYVQTELTEWNRTASHPRRMGVSSFGAGGSNAHLILEESPQAREPESASHPERPELFVLSARDQDALCRYAERVVRSLESVHSVSMANIAYTSQVARTPMDTRLAVIASSVEDLKDKLTQWITLRENKDIRSRSNTDEVKGVFSGNVREAQFSVGNLIEGRIGKAFVEDLLVNRNLEKIAKLWTLGVAMDWSLMCRDSSPRRVSFPTYPFAKERFWIDHVTLSTPVVQKNTQDAGKTPAPAPAEEKRRTYYRSQWSRKALATSAEKSQAVGPILILDSSEELFLQMKDLLEKKSGNNSIILVKPGESFQEIGPGMYVLDPQREEQFHLFVENLRNTARLPGMILHHTSEVCNLEAKEQMIQQLNNGVYTLVCLCRALRQEKHEVPLRIMSAFSSPSGTTAPLAAAMGGFFRTLMLENPKYLAKVVDIEGDLKSSRISLSEKAGLIWDELCDQDWSAPEICYRAHEHKQRLARYVNALVPYTVADKGLSALPLRQKGVYLITGGLGGLGLIFAEYLAKNFQAKLVLSGRSIAKAEQEEKLGQLQAYGAEILCLKADVSKLEDMEMVVREAKTRFSEINGVIHAAGVNRDAFILKKTRQEMEAVLEPKVYGAVNVDLATSSENLDLFVLFSSIAGVAGNVGQSDYAYANRFLDHFAENRETLRRTQKRSGRTVSINWPLWEAGGMRISQDDIARLEKQTGICPLPKHEGIRSWEDILRSGAFQIAVLYGIPSKIAAYLAGQPVKANRKVTIPVQDVDRITLLAKTETYLKALISEEIKLPPDRIGSSDRFESFGIDSVMINEINTNLERNLGALPKTLLYEHETVGDLAAFLVREAQEGLMALFDFAGLGKQPAIPSIRVEEEANQDQVSIVEKGNHPEPIAIIGIHGYYPHSVNLDEYWKNLKDGRDLIDVVPLNRWNYEDFYDPDPAAAAEGKIYCKWGGFLDDYDKFDPRFFNISVAEAKIIDPQERIFLQSVWAAVEDAGYTRESLKKRFPKAKSADVGVFVGVTTNSYHLLTSDEISQGNVIRPAALPWSIANRVSYWFDFSGPSIPVDTACSSSLVAIHLACESLKNRECQVAIAGGVNLYLHPSKYQSLCQKRMLSLSGKCRSYGAGDNGFVPGEGVGSVVLKPLTKAIADRDHIYAVISGSAYDHSGRSNGYSAPNPNSQAYLFSRLFRKSKIHPESISYVEGHGTGTQLGDSIEIAALTQAFQTKTTKTQFCAIGSVKANIGHSESAAGIAGVTKVLLQMKHQQLLPSIYSDEVNPDIEFMRSPFYLQHGLSKWESSPDLPRRALVNSFGAGGVNACVVLEEYKSPCALEERPKPGSHLFLVSAKDQDRLREYVDCLLLFLKKEQDVNLANLCYTLQVGREAMEERLAIVVADVNELIGRLEEWSSQGNSASVFQGTVRSSHAAKWFSTASQAVLSNQRLMDLAAMWIKGEEAEWEKLYSGSRPQRIAAPTYPFARERHWISGSLVSGQGTSQGIQLHPLISHNSSTLREFSFNSMLSDTSFYALDHRVQEENILPGAAFLEMACMAGNIAGERSVSKIRDIVWVRPLSFRKGPQTLRTCLRQTGDSIEYVISSFGDENETIVHSEGKLVFRSDHVDRADEKQMPIQALKAQCPKPQKGSAYYSKFRRHGFNYGPSFRAVQELYVNGSFALAKLNIPDHLKNDFDQYILHPSLIDGALQATAALAQGSESGSSHLPFSLEELEILYPLAQTCYAYAELADSGEQNRSSIRKFHVRLLNENGDLLVKLYNLVVRAVSGDQIPSRPTVKA